MSTRVHFIHLRSFDKEDRVQGTGGATVAYHQLDDGTIEYAVSWCSPQDNFNKAYGRAKAKGRLGSDRYRAIARESNLSEFRENVYNDVYSI